MGTNKWNVKGKIIEIMPLKASKNNNGDYYIQEYVIEAEDNEYPFKFAFFIMGMDKINSCNLKLGDYIEVVFNVIAKKWNDKWYNTVRAWKVNKITNTHNEAAPMPKNNSHLLNPKYKEKKIVSEIPEELDNLPF